MRAVCVTAPGGAENLEVREIARPVATADQVLVRVKAAGVNRADILQRMGRYPAPPGAPSNIPGLEFAGEVVETGSEARRWQVGQRVFGITAGGAQADYVIVPEEGLAEIPANLDFVGAAAVPEAFMTAHDALFTQGELEMGECVVVHAAGSGVGTAAVQLARVAGARVCGTGRTAEKLERARSLGLDEAIVIEGDPRNFVERVREWSGGAGANLVLDLVGASLFAANLDALAMRGRLLIVGTLGGVQAEIDFSKVMSKRLRITGTVLRSRSKAEKAEVTRRFAAHVVPLLARGEVQPVIDSVYKLNDVRAAHERMESNESFGKIVLTT
ncbi:MAG: NAD(P)H-quinone oxidoreductase [Pyrinomonadaceae bacterium]|nr:NAD(P)H-quinone oxidoreductase [Pyrinomonadaceae bacterium]